jgi:glycosyltransferase involved in cell wall biosynthesis
MITFFGMPSRSSGKIRGLEMSQALDGNFYDKNSLKLESGPPGFFKTCVFIRDIELSHAIKLKAAGHKIVYDVLDRPVADLHIEQKSNPKTTEINWKKYVHSCIDVFLVNNSLCKEKLDPYLGNHQSVIVTPHHVVSNDIIPKNNIEKIPKKVGYLGVQNQIHQIDKIRNFCKDNNLDFVSTDLKTKEECVEFLKDIDIGIVFLEENDRTQYVLKYKPSVKLINFQAMGIPSVCSPYESFKECAPPTSYICSDDIDKTLDSIKMLKNNTDLRNSIYENGLKNAENYTLEKVVKIYKEICD